MFVLSASSGTLTDRTLELTGADADVTVFADRPERSASTEALADLAKDWEDLGFVADPPNAALVSRGEGGPATTVVELGAPEVDGDDVSFPVTPVEGKVEGALALVHSGAQPEDLVQPSLFIDSGSASSLVPVTIDGTWGAGDTRVIFDWWYFSQTGGTYMTFEMGEPGTIDFTAATEFMSLTTADALTGTFSGIGLTTDVGSFYGQASVPGGSDLTIGVCGSGGPTAPLVQGSYSLDLPASC